MKSGNPNVKHMHEFTVAEQAALDKKYARAHAAYKRAIVSAARSGHLHHAALLNERYADFLERDILDKEEYRYRMREAIRFYREWGADSKVEMLLLLTT